MMKKSNELKKLAYIGLIKESFRNKPSRDNRAAESYGSSCGGCGGCAGGYSETV